MGGGQIERKFNVVLSSRLDLFKIHNGVCKKETNPCPAALKTNFSADSPVCGSDGRSYINYQALLCASARMHTGEKNGKILGMFNPPHKIIFQ